MKNITLLIAAALIFCSTLSFASPFLNQWAGSCVDADNFFANMVMVMVN